MNGVEESVPIFTVTIESKNEEQATHHRKSSSQNESVFLCGSALIPEIENSGLYNKPEEVLESFECSVEPLSQGGLLCMAHVVVKHPG